MKELVIPSLPSNFETELEADLLVAENLRGKWCTYVGLADIEGMFVFIYRQIEMCLGKHVCMNEKRCENFI